jgi:hypothetical protein
MRPRSGFLLILMLAFPLAPAAAEATGSCLKQVFDDYCLGGSMRQLLQRRPGGIPAQHDGERSAVVYLHGRERTYVMAYQGRIYKILHTFEPANQLKLKELRQRLEAKYGPYRDLSHYPGYARSLATKIGAIRRGDGELRHSWQSQDGSWRIELAWTRKLGISLAYLANELDARQREALDGGL